MPVVVDLELEGGEQPAQDRLGQLRQPIAIAGDWEGVEEVDGVGLLVLVGEGGEFLELGVALLVEVPQVVLEFVDDQGGLLVVVVEALVEREGADQAARAGVEVVDGALQSGLLPLEVLLCGLVEAPQVLAQTVAAVGVEDALGEEVHQPVEEVVLADVDACGVVGAAAEQQFAVLFWGGAAVVGVA